MRVLPNQAAATSDEDMIPDIGLSSDEDGGSHSPVRGQRQPPKISQPGCSKNIERIGQDPDQAAEPDRSAHGVVNESFDYEDEEAYKKEMKRLKMRHMRLKVRHLGTQIDADHAWIMSNALHPMQWM